MDYTPENPRATPPHDSMIPAQHQLETHDDEQAADGSIEPGLEGGAAGNPARKPSGRPSDRQIPEGTVNAASGEKCGPSRTPAVGRFIGT